MWTGVSRGNGSISSDTQVECIHKRLEVGDTLFRDITHSSSVSSTMAEELLDKTSKWKSPGPCPTGSGPVSCIV